MDSEREAHKLGLTVLVIVVMVLLFGCADPKTVTVVEYKNQLQHPETLPTPAPPGAKVRVITKERIMDGELPDRAYVGFSYPDWLEYAKWMHEYKAYIKSLQNAVKEYEKQDSRSGSDASN
ncbi:Rz-like spanin [Vibrio phage D51]